MGRRNGNRSRRRGGLGALSDIVLLCFTLLCAGLLLCAYLARYVSPEKAWFFAFAALIAPMLIVGNILAFFYWCVRWKRWAFVPLGALVLGVGYFPLFFKPEFKQHYPKEQPKDALTVVTYNVMGFLAANPDGGLRWAPEGSTSFLRETAPDIVCIQEFQCTGEGRKAQLDSLIGLPYCSVNYRIASAKGGGWGVAIYSRYPIIEGGKLDFPNSTNSSVWGDVVVGKDTLRVFSNHLQTTSVDKTELDYISRHEFVDNSRRGDDVVRGIASKLRRNFRIRATQADTLAHIIGQSPFRVIVCGDFNDTPMSYAYFRMRGDLDDAFVEKGRGMASNTFNGLFDMLRIDYVFTSPEIEVLDYATTDTGHSDHKAVTVRIRIPKP